MVNLDVQGEWVHKIDDGPWSEWQKNIVVSNGAKVVAGGLGNLPNSLYLALGSGDASWAGTAPPAPSKDATGLTSEFARRPVDNVTYIEEYVGVHNVAAGQASTEIQAPIFAELDEGLFINRLIEIIDGAGKGDVRTILDTNGSSAFVDSDFSQTPDATTVWRVGVVSLVPTNIVDLQTTFPATESNAKGQIREAGLFGGLATDELGSGDLINLIHHPVITKQEKSELTRVVRLRFNIT